VIHKNTASAIKATVGTKVRTAAINLSRADKAARHPIRTQTQNSPLQNMNENQKEGFIARETKSEIGYPGRNLLVAVKLKRRATPVQPSKSNQRILRLGTLCLKLGADETAGVSGSFTSCGLVAGVLPAKGEIARLLAPQAEQKRALGVIGSPHSPQNMRTSLSRNAIRSSNAPRSLSRGSPVPVCRLIVIKELRLKVEGIKSQDHS